ncbi:unnamed protein product [Acanthoscelides obtectus]|uniref:Uncharacterized protein n=1 Tax=Acanthoscelides obtectus TaxID=200917 RepID=A0A9P0L3S4_ACAOB|nr:unnamed protein product [Acanthoscelides obtectus]CAK1666400.1 hypothetical protein AOBTE_LOCUS25306 [Acanthoscelides obtectus]
MSVRERLSRNDRIGTIAACGMAAYRPRYDQQHNSSGTTSRPINIHELKTVSDRWIANGYGQHQASDELRGLV